MTSLDHRLADTGPVLLEVLADHTVLSGRSTEPEYWEDMYAIVSAGESVHSLGEHVTRFQVRPDIVYRRIEDGPGLRWGLVWHAETASDLVRALAAVVEDLGEARL